jgi:hypothetical protein
VFVSLDSKHPLGKDKAVPLPRGLRSLLAWPFAADRMDTWVLKASIVIFLVCIAALGLWHLVAYLVGKLPKKPRTVRQSPEPPSSSQSPQLLPRVPTLADVASIRDDPERLQQACTALEDSLAEIYRELAESWLRTGQPQKATAALKKILQLCPDRHQAQLAQDRLQQIGKDTENHPS